MHFAAGSVPHDAVIFVHHLEALRTGTRGLVLRPGASAIRERDPLLQTQLLRPRSRIEADGRGDVFPARYVFAQQIPKLLATLRKPGADDPEKRLGIVWRQFIVCSRRDAHER